MRGARQGSWDGLHVGGLRVGDRAGPGDRCGIRRGGFRQLTDMVQQALPVGAPPDEARRRAIALVSGMVGGLAIARALEKADPDLSRDVLAAAREELERLAFAPRGEPKFG